MSRTERLKHELAGLAALKQASTSLEYQAEGAAPERYVITFRGRGACRAGATRGGVEIVSVHRCELRLPFTYPTDAPDVRWLTPLMHPNVSYSGFLSWREIGIDWHPDMTLGVVCERLWDVVRLAYVNTTDVLNYSAQRWLEEQNRTPLPLDIRPLRDIVPPANPNIISYARRDGVSRPVSASAAGTEVLFIGEDTPVPVLRQPRRDDDILYIGDE
jgi:hypothetical protein